MLQHIATTLFLTTILASSEPITTDDEPVVIRGKAFLAGSNKPAAHVTLHFFDRRSPELTAVTDAGGRFRYSPPERFPLGVVQDGATGPPCWVEIHDAGRWSWRPIRFAPSRSLPGAPQGRKDVAG
jgi:hypothetical protein